MAKENVAANLEGLSDWGDFPFVTPVAIVTTVDREGIQNAAPKSRIMPVMFLSFTAVVLS